MKKVKLELIGLDGDARNLMAQFQRAARRQGWPQAEIDVVLKFSIQRPKTNAGQGEKWTL